MTATDVATSIRRTLPGLAMAAAVAAAAIVATRILPATIGSVLVAVLLGLVIGNTLRLPAVTAPGIQVASRQVLQLGVVLLGAKLTVTDIAAIGGSAVWLVIVTMSAAFATVALASRAAGVPPRLATLIATGTAVCGNSAIMATAPIIDAEDREISFAVATITIFGTVALLTFPLIAHVAELPDRVFGFWAGLAINDTSQVVAAGAAYSEEALEVATVVKLVRNAFMAPLVLLLGWWTARDRASSGGDGGEGDVRGGALRAFPAFLLGFLALSGLRSLGVLSADLASSLGQLATVAITVAIAGVGLRTRIGELRKVGLRPFLVGLGAATTVAVIGIAFAVWLEAG